MTDTARTYQTSLTVTALDGAAPIFVGQNAPELCAAPVIRLITGLRPRNEVSVTQVVVATASEA